MSPDRNPVNSSAGELWARMRDLQEAPLSLVAIGGRGGAGKSTLANLLRDILPGVTLVRMDDFYRLMDPDLRSSLSPEEGCRQYMDWERMRDQVLDPLKAGRAARYQSYDWVGEEERLLPEWHEVRPRGTVIVEGVGSFRSELFEYYDLTVYVETPVTECLDRLRRRGHNPEVWIQRWAAAEEWCVQNYRPQEKAGVVVAGDEPFPDRRSTREL